METKGRPVAPAAYLFFFKNTNRFLFEICWERVGIK